MHRSKIAVLCDFDGTIVNIDTAEYTLDRFAEGDWKALDEKLDKSEIPLEECMGLQFEMVKTSRDEIVRELDRVTETRPGFEEMVTCCEKMNVPLTITSAGLDFYIEHFLKARGLGSRIRVVAPSVTVTEKGVRFAFPPLLLPESIRFKDDMVRQTRELGWRVVYIGDGTTDYNAASIADLPFAVWGSKLARKLRAGCIEHFEFLDFREIVERIRAMR